MKTASALFATAASIAIAASPVLASPASAAPSTVRYLGGCRAQGDFATCVASGNVNHPSSIHVHVVARPGQHVSGSWSMTCSKGLGAGSKSGNIRGWASLKHNLYQNLRMPYRHPDSCSVAADAQLSHGGHLHIWLTARN
jgi:hypothetical protein